MGSRFNRDPVCVISEHAWFTIWLFEIDGNTMTNNDENHTDESDRCVPKEDEQLPELVAIPKETNIKDVKESRGGTCAPAMPKGGRDSQGNASEKIPVAYQSGASKAVDGSAQHDAASEGEHGQLPDNEPQTRRVLPTLLPPRARPEATSTWARELIRATLIPGLTIVSILVGIFALGIAQRSGWISSGSGDGSNSNEAGSSASDVSYICPMMCVPPTGKPGRCPVCAMELVPASANASSGPASEIQIDSRSRRVAGIQTVVAEKKTLSREVRVVGEISYDESRQKTLVAYVDGRIEKLYADYTGVVIEKNDSLAMVYSPELYSAQVEFARMLEYSKGAGKSSLRIENSNRKLLLSSRERLFELGMTDDQIAKLENGKPVNRRLTLHAPISGTVIEKLAVEGQDIKAGMPIYRLADLSNVWVVLELFPEDAKSVRIGQTVSALTQSMGNEACIGSVEFIEPTVDPITRTIGIRVSIDNEHGHLKPGEFVNATLEIPLLSKEGLSEEVVVIPRNSLLSIGTTSLAYVEKKPGEFHLRHLKTGPTVNGQIAVFEGIEAGENVVSRSAFLIDAQMQLQGNPSLIDPDKIVATDPKDDELTAAELEEIRTAFEPLNGVDHDLATKQVICPVTEVRLGTLGMGTPIKLEIKGRDVFICCEGCRKSWVEEPDRYFKILDDFLAGKATNVSAVGNDASNIASVPESDLPQMSLPEFDNSAIDVLEKDNDPIVGDSTLDLPQMELPKK